MRKIKMMTSAVLLSLSLAFSITACGTKSEPAADTTAAEAEVTETESEAETAEEAANDEEEKVKVGVSWNADEIDKDAQVTPYLTKNIVKLQDLTAGTSCLLWEDENEIVTKVMIFAE